MRKLIFITIFLISEMISAQHLNFAGHLINKSFTHDTFETDNNSGNLNSISTTGLTKLSTHFGHLTIMSNDDDALSVIQLYDQRGILITKISFRQTINFTLSPDRKFAAFHDTRSIQWVDLSNGTVTEIQGSNIFTFSGENSFAYYNEKNGSVHFNGNEIRIEKNVNHLLFYHNKLLITTRNEILLAKENSLIRIFSGTAETIFDLEIIDDKFFMSTKKVFSDHFEFNSYFTTDLKSFYKDEKVIYPLKHSAINSYHTVDRTTTLPGEQIRNPINYYQDTVYQPVGNSYDEIQDYSMGASIYPHPGVDLMGVFMQDVYSVKPGFVKAILTTSAEFHWRIAIGNENIPDSSTGYLYAHLEETSIPYVVGDSVAEGAVIGHLVDFPVTGFVHCHFARIYDEGFTWNGGWWTYDNPLSYMTNFFDSMPPVFEKTIGNDAFAFRDSLDIYLTPDSLFGKVKIISKVYDLINSTWKVDVNKLRYSLSPLSNPQTMLLDTFAYEFNFFNDNYNAGPYIHQLLRTIYSFDQTCFSTGNYTDRDFYHIITNSDGNDTIDATDSLLFFDTQTYADGDYIFRVIASDPSENSTTDSMIIRIRNLSTNLHEINETSGVSISPNPFERYVEIKFEKEITRIENLSIRDFLGKEVYSKPTTHHLNENSIQIDLGSLATGIYFISFNYGDKVFSGKLICK